MHEELLHPGATFAHLAHGQAVYMADMIAVLNFRPGGESGPARIRLKPAARCAAAFMGSSRPRRARVSSPGATSTVPECAVVSWRGALAVRPPRSLRRPGRLTAGFGDPSQDGVEDGKALCRGAQATVLSDQEPSVDDGLER